MKPITLDQAAPQFIQALQSGGAFLNVQDAGGRPNTMTIGWGQPGVVWGKPCVTVLVRPSRFSHHMLEENAVFTVSVPVPGEMGDALRLCGRESGRDGDKFAKAGLTAKPAQKVDGVIIGECPLHIECRVVYKQEMMPALLDPAIDNSAYASKDYHTLYYGEVLAVYQAD